MLYVGAKTQTLPQNNLGETALHYAGRVNKKNASYKAGDDREMANLLLTNGAHLMVLTSKVTT